jgi:hypothetical protein
MDVVPPTGPEEIALLRWDLSGQFVDGTVVENVSITLQITDPSDDDYALFAALRPWTEDERIGSPKHHVFCAGGIGTQEQTNDSHACSR